MDRHTGIKRTIFKLAILFLVATPYFTSAQAIKFEHLNTRNGLSHNSVLSILQDSRGFMWFGTYGGLNKYDGYRITTYKSEHGEKNSLRANAIVSIFEDSEGLLWLGTYGGGVISFDPKKEIFTDDRYLHLDPKLGVIPNVRSIYEDESGSLWFATSEGLDKFDKKKKTHRVYQVEAEVHADNNVVMIEKSKGGHFWLATYLGLKKFNPKTGEFTNYKPDPSNPNSVAHPNTLVVHEDPSGIVWIGTEGSGLDAFDPATGNFIHYKNDQTNPASLSGNVVYAIEPYSTNELLIATESGLNVLDLQTRTFTHITHDPEDPGSLSSNNTRCIYKDKGGVLWIGTDGGGVNRTDTHRKKFNLYQKELNNAYSLSNNNVFSIAEDTIGNIWVGTIEGGLNRFDPDTKRFEPFTPDPKDRYSISSNKILSLSTGPSGNLWIGTDRDGISMLSADQLDNSGKLKFLRYYRDTKPNSINSNVVYSILEDRKGIVWAGTWSRGLNKIVFKEKTKSGSIDYTKPEITHFRRDINDSSSISHDVIFTLYEDSKGTLWIGTVGGGLNKHEVITKKLNGEDVQVDVFKHYLNDPDNSSSLSDNNVSAIHESRNGDFWVGTSVGINKFNRSDGTCKVYTTKDGLPNNVVFGIIEDLNGNLWIGTLGGMSKFDPVKETFRNYGFEDGLQDNMFNPHAFALTKRGEMYFGGPNGITSFYPDSIRNNAYRPEVVITDFKIFNKSVAIGPDKGGNERLNTTISTADAITLSHKDYVFSFEFSASNYANPMKNKFAYRMEGFDEDWVYTDANNRNATYTNLNPGKYTFRVKASNGDGVWNEEGVGVRIYIVPPFWQTLWFKIFAAMTICGVLFLIYRIRVRIINRQKEELEVLVTERTKEIMSQKEEIQSQKENIEEKNVILERQYQEIEAGRKEIKEKNQKLEEYNLQLEQKVRERTEQLRKAFNNLAETNKELDQFIYRSAHDLKGPLASIRGLCYLGTLETEEPKIRGLLDKMEATTGDLTNKLTRLMKIHEFNTMELEIEPIDYKLLLHEIITEIKAANHCTDVDIKWNVEAEGTYKCDRRLTRILLKNLIENSVRYKDEAKPHHYVNIQVKVTPGSSHISIADNGIGIPAEQADRIFDLFVIATENGKGFGIGLYEAKLITRRLKGNIKLQYAQNGDTEFVVTL